VYAAARVSIPLGGAIPVLRAAVVLLYNEE